MNTLRTREASPPIKSLTGTQYSENPSSFRYSGHGTFTCRYTWLPKVVRSLLEKPALFSDEDDAMIRLGVGKNMVRSIKFWAESSGVIEQDTDRRGAYKVTDFGRKVFGPNGYDEFLENIHTLWLIHWNISTCVSDVPFAWFYLLNHWHRIDFTKAEAVVAFEQETAQESRTLSPVTLEEHCTIFIRSYVTNRGGKQSEDTLDCPLNELGLLEDVGERMSTETGRRESIYAFHVEEKNDISPALFVYCLYDFWNTAHANEKTLSARSISSGIGSPGQVFKLPEHAIRERLEKIESDSSGLFYYQESASIQQVVRLFEPSYADLLHSIYEGC